MLFLSSKASLSVNRGLLKQFLNLPFDFARRRGWGEAFDHISFLIHEKLREIPLNTRPE